MAVDWRPPDDRAEHDDRALDDRAKLNHIECKKRPVDGNSHNTHHVSFF
jgi:hypothetical protein